MAVWLGSNVGQFAALEWPDWAERCKDWDQGAEWSLDKLIRIGDAYGFWGDRLGQWPIFNSSDVPVRTTRQPGCWLGAGGSIEVQSCSICQDINNCLGGSGSCRSIWQKAQLCWFLLFHRKQKLWSLPRIKYYIFQHNSAAFPTLQLFTVCQVEKKQSAQTHKIVPCVQVQGNTSQLQLYSYSCIWIITEHDTAEKKAFYPLSTPLILHGS